jgi:hypothetical protein
MLEKSIEQHLRNRAKDIGGKAYKFVSPGNGGVPDRVLAFPGRIIVFVETKAPGKKSTPQQRKRQQEFADFGFPVFRDVDSIEKVEQVIKYCEGLIRNAI